MRTIKKTMVDTPSNDMKIENSRLEINWSQEFSQRNRKDPENEKIRQRVFFNTFALPNARPRFLDGGVGRVLGTGLDRVQMVSRTCHFAI